MIRPLVLAGLALLTAQACRDSRAEEPPRPLRQAATNAQDLAGRFVSHPEHIQPGMVKPFAGLQMKNPFEGDAKAVATGGKLFLAYNCVDCHGADGSGAMGPVSPTAVGISAATRARSSSQSTRVARRGCPHGAASSPRTRCGCSSATCEHYRRTRMSPRKTSAARRWSAPGTETLLVVLSPSLRLRAGFATDPHVRLRSVRLYVLPWAGRHEAQNENRMPALNEKLCVVPADTSNDVASWKSNLPM